MRVIYSGAHWYHKESDVLLEAMKRSRRRAVLSLY